LSIWTAEVRQKSLALPRFDDLNWLFLDVDDPATLAIVDRDLALEMLRVGWACTTPMMTGPYAAAQHYAMSARYGMWATDVLDMAEWREKAVDRESGP